MGVDLHFEQVLSFLVIRIVDSLAVIRGFQYFTSAIFDLDRLSVMQKLVNFFLESLLGVHLEY